MFAFSPTQWMFPLSPTHQTYQNEAQLRPSAEALQLGAQVTIGRYSFRVTSLLGRGSQGSVWSATRTDGATVAIKETLCRSDTEEVDAEREQNILQLVSGISKRCPSVIASETIPDNAGKKMVRIAMTQIPGEPLASFLDNYKSSTVVSNASTAAECFGEARRFTFALLSQLAGALQSISVVALHRDISADNVLVTSWNGASEPEFGLIDFGLAIQTKSWPSLMTQICAVGNCQHWPVSAWCLFLYGGKKLCDNEGLRKEYLTQLDLHGLGILGLHVFMALIPRCAFAYLPEEMNVLRCAWDHYWAESRRFSDEMHLVPRGLSTWDSVRQNLIMQHIDHIIDSALAQVHQALAKVRQACVHAGPHSPLSNTDSLFEAISHLISCDREGKNVALWSSKGFEGKRGNASWTSLNSILEGRAMPASAASRMPESGNTAASTRQKDSNMKPPHILLISGAKGANAKLVNGIYDISGAYNGKSSWQKRDNEKYWLLTMNGRWWVTDADSKATNRITGWAKSSKAELPRSATSWEIWDGSKWDSQAITVSEVTTQEVACRGAVAMPRESVTQIPLPKVQTVEKSIEHPKSSIIEKVVAVPEVVTQNVLRQAPMLQRTQPLPAPQVQTAEKHKMIPQIQKVERNQLLQLPVPQVQTVEKVKMTPLAQRVEKTMPISQS
mmetsp:Transcript_57192/g.90916  ORF Transcript_57192/g.90916 Transcript_57192/m.90916 type:complete len:671 (+) Transcript_57192:46-2058(+)